MLEHRAELAALRDRIRVHQPSFENMKAATDHDVRKPKAFFEALGVRLRVSGLPACNTPGMDLIELRPILPCWTFDAGTGRFDIHALTRFHIQSGYRSKSSRCDDCAIADRCDGMHINMIRDQGLKLLEPMTRGPWLEDARAQLVARYPEPLARIRTGRPFQPPAESLPGFAKPDAVPQDPLAMVEEQRRRRKEERLAEAKALFAASPTPEAK
jgi:hypothetical protein